MLRRSKKARPKLKPARYQGILGHQERRIRQIREEVAETLYELLFDFMPTNQNLDITDSTKIEAFGMDSLDIIEFCLEIETEFPGIEINDEDMDRIHTLTVGAIIDLVTGKVVSYEWKK